MPPKPVRELRELTRRRKTLVRDRQREAGRLHKTLEDTGIKLDRVAADILGVSGRAMLKALIDGTSDPQLLAELARGRLRAKLPDLREALEGRFTGRHALLIDGILRHVDFLDAEIDALGGAIEAHIDAQSKHAREAKPAGGEGAAHAPPLDSAVRIACSLDGIQRRTAETLIGEVGADTHARPRRPDHASVAATAPSPAGLRAPVRAGGTTSTPRSPPAHGTAPH